MSPGKKETVPPEWLDPESLPDDLRWIPAHYKLHPGDPVYLLLAWHWRRLQRSEDVLRALALELRTPLDNRIETLTEAAETVAGVGDALAGVQAELEQKPAQLAGQIDTLLAKPLGQAVAQLQTLEKSLATIAPGIRASQHRQLLAALLIGVTLGVLLALSVFLA